MTGERFIGATIVIVALAQTPTAPKKGGNPEAAKIKNPVATSAESIAAGRRVYQRLCTRWHRFAGEERRRRGGRRSVRLERCAVGLRRQRRRDLHVDPRRHVDGYGRLRGAHQRHRHLERRQFPQDVRRAMTTFNAKSAKSAKTKVSLRPSRPLRF